MPENRQPFYVTHDITFFGFPCFEMEKFRNGSQVNAKELIHLCYSKDIQTHSSTFLFYCSRKMALLSN